MGEYVIKVKIGNGIAIYRFDNLERALEILEQIKEKGEEYTTNFA